MLLLLNLVVFKILLPLLLDYQIAISILKASFKKPLPKEVFHKDYKHFNGEDLKEELPAKLGGFVYYDLFENIFRTFRHFQVQIMDPI